MAGRKTQNPSPGYLSRLAGTRLERLETELGITLSKAQLRGKPQKGELSISVLRLAKSGTPAEKYDYVARQIYEGKSATVARKEVKLSDAKFKEARKNDPTSKKERGRYRVSTEGVFTYLDREGRTVKGLRLIGESRVQFHAYEDAYRKAVFGLTAKERAEGEKRLKSFAKVKFYDADGKRIYPATSLKDINKSLKTANASQRARFAERFYEKEAA